MPKPVFLSYSRSTSGPHAIALRDALGASECFLDQRDIELGSEFPKDLTDALLASRVFVAFVDAKYFERWYCLREWLLARAPFDQLLRDRTGEPELSAALAHFVLVLGDGVDERVIRRLPPVLQCRNWPLTSDTAATAKLVRAHLASNPPTLAERLLAARVGDGRRKALVDTATIPPPGNLGRLRRVPCEFPESKRDGFVGRANELWRLHVALVEPRLGSANLAGVTGALQGGGGFGKTQLALEYLHRFGPIEYTGGVFWIDATLSSPVEAQLYRVLKVLLPDVPPLEEFRDRGLVLREELSNAVDREVAGGKSLLFVVDNVPEAMQDGSAPDIAMWCPALGRVTCLATSRKHLDLAAGFVEALVVDVLEHDAAVELLCENVPDLRELEKADWNSIADWVGRLPLALRLLNAALRLGALRPTELLHRSRETSVTKLLDEQMERLRPLVRREALRGVTETFRLSYEFLDESAQCLARRIAWCAAVPIPDALFDALGESLGDVGRLRALLTDRGVLSRLRIPTLHGVLADFLRNQGSQWRPDAIAAALALTAVVRRADLDNPFLRAAGESLMPDLVALADHVARARSGPDAEVAESLRALASAADDLGARCESRVPMDASLRVYERAASLANRADSPLLWARIQNERGNALLRLGEREEGTKRLEEAVEACRAALEVRTREQAPADWAMTQNNLGTVLSRLGEREEGTKRLEEAVEAYRAALEVYTREHVPVGWAMAQNNLGNALSRRGEREEGTKRLEEAVEAYRAALEVYTRKETPVQWAMTQNNLGTVLSSIGEREEGTKRLEEAAEAYRAALEVYTRKHAPVGWAMTQNNLGIVLLRLGEREEGTKRLEEAVEAYRAALEVYTRKHAPVGWAMTQNNLGIVLLRLGEREEGTKRLEEAAEAYRAALEVYTREQAPVDWAMTQNNLGNVLSSLGEREDGTTLMEEAVEAYRAALEVHTEEQLPHDHRGTKANLEDAERLLEERRRGSR